MHDCIDLQVITYDVEHIGLSLRAEITIEKNMHCVWL